MTKGLQSGLFKTAKKYKASPILLIPIFTANLMLSCFSNFGNPLPTPLIRGGGVSIMKQKKRKEGKNSFILSLYVFGTCNMKKQKYYQCQ